jgi:hypothetical protein
LIAQDEPITHLQMREFNEYLPQISDSLTSLANLIKGYKGVSESKIEIYEKKQSVAPVIISSAEMLAKIRADVILKSLESSKISILDLAQKLKDDPNISQDKLEDILRNKANADNFQGLIAPYGPDEKNMLATAALVVMNNHCAFSSSNVSHSLIKAISVPSDSQNILEKTQAFKEECEQMIQVAEFACTTSSMPPNDPNIVEVKALQQEIAIQIKTLQTVSQKDVESIKQIVKNIESIGELILEKEGIFLMDDLTKGGKISLDSHTALFKAHIQTGNNNEATKELEKVKFTTDKFIKFFENEIETSSDPVYKRDLLTKVTELKNGIWIYYFRYRTFNFCL